jgi:hypothetical protein
MNLVAKLSARPRSLACMEAQMWLITGRFILFGYQTRELDLTAPIAPPAGRHRGLLPERRPLEVLRLRQPFPSS